MSLPRLRVLSLFDGIGTGYYCLQELGFDIEVYYASEVDPNAKMVTWSHFGDKITHLGSVTEIDEAKLEEIGPINFLIGGSPCSDLSLVNANRKGIYEATGTGVLFFEFYRIWNSLRLKNKKEKQIFYWLFENVARMEIKNSSVISLFLETEPGHLDSIKLSPQCRKRLFWSNIPNLDTIAKTLMKSEDDGPVLDDYLDKNLGRKANVEKICTITTKRSCLQDGSSRNPVNVNGEDCGLYITEVEKIFGFPTHYTDVGDMNPNERHKLIGKSWSVQVVKYIFKLLYDTFKTK